MPSPTWHFDGALRRIYEVPPGASYTTDANGHRLYDGGPLPQALLTADVKADLWSRWVDWHAQNDWALPAFDRSGGNQRPTGEYASTDFALRTSDGWRIVLANYPHETVLQGNLFAQGADSLFDFTRLGVNGVVPRLQGSANLLTYNTSAAQNVVTGDLATVPSLVQIVEAVLAAVEDSNVIAKEQTARRAVEMAVVAMSS